MIDREKFGEKRCPLNWAEIADYLNALIDDGYGTEEEVWQEWLDGRMSAITAVFKEC